MWRKVQAWLHVEETGQVELRMEALLQEQGSMLSTELGVCVSVSSECLQYCSRKAMWNRSHYTVFLVVSIIVLLWGLKKIIWQNVWVFLKQAVGGLIAGYSPGMVLCRPWHGGQGLYLSDPVWVCVSVFVCVYEWFGEGEGGGLSEIRSYWVSFIYFLTP